MKAGEDVYEITGRANGKGLKGKDEVGDRASVWGRLHSGLPSRDMSRIDVGSDTELTDVRRMTLYYGR